MYKLGDRSLSLLIFFLLQIIVGPVLALKLHNPVVHQIVAIPPPDYATTANVFDRIVNPAADIATTRQMIDRLVDAARQMAGPNPTDAYKLAAIRKAIYVAGPWNYNRAFAYDMTDPRGTNPRNKLLSTYIRTRRGNCISMPILFLIIADRMGLDVGLAYAPLHMFVRYRDKAGVEHNLETTSGGHEARLEWYRQNLPMTDRSIESGAYMRKLNRRESVAAMAEIVMDNLADDNWQDMIDITSAILEVDPRNVYALSWRAFAHRQRFVAEIVSRYPAPGDIPPTLREHALMLGRASRADISKAAELGWEPSK